MRHFKPTDRGAALIMHGSTVYRKIYCATEDHAIRHGFKVIAYLKQAYPLLNRNGWRVQLHPRPR